MAVYDWTGQPLPLWIRKAMEESSKPTEWNNLKDWVSRKIWRRK